MLKKQIFDSILKAKMLNLRFDFMLKAKMSNLINESLKTTITQKKTHMGPIDQNGSIKLIGPTRTKPTWTTSQNESGQFDSILLGP